MNVMNPSLSILEKLKNQFYQTVASKGDYHVAFAPFAFTLTNEDFFFLKSNIETGEGARKYYKEQAEFSIIANSLLQKPFLWAIDGEKLLYNIYRDILSGAATIDPDFLTEEEQLNIANAEKILYTPEKTYTNRYIKYREFAAKNLELERKILDHDILKSSLQTENDLARWKLESDRLHSERNALLMDWQVIGERNFIESAMKIIDTKNEKTKFIKKWNEARDIKLKSPYLLVDGETEYLATTCIPNGICDYQSPIWKKISLTEQEIIQLQNNFISSTSNEIVTEFGNINVVLESITFEYCFLDIIRPWFDETVINNRYWDFREEGRVLSYGADSLSGENDVKGEAPSYPVKIILAKNIEFTFKHNVPVNEELKNNLRNGSRIMFGPLLRKTIPENLPDAKVTSFRVQQLSANQLSIMTKAAFKADVLPDKKDGGRKFEMLKVINKQPLANTKKVIESKPFVNRNVHMVAATTLSGQQKNIKPMPGRFKWPFQPGKPQVPPQQDKLITISGKIIDENNKPIPLAEVEIMVNESTSSQSVLSDDNGSYTINGLKIGSYHFTVKKNGYAPGEKSMSLAQDLTQNFLLAKLPVPTESFNVLGVVCKNLPKLPDPIIQAKYI
jgi:hypothetical protein